MAQSKQEFARLLTEGIYRIRSQEGKSIGIIQDELGFALGREGGTAVEHWRRGNAPPKWQDVEALGQIIFERGQMDDAWLRAFYYHGGHPAPENSPAKTAPLPQITLIAEDGRYPTDSKGIHPPLPAFDAQFLEHLTVPGGAVRLRDKFYIERKDDRLLRHQITRPGSIVTIRAPRQTGKSSMLIRALAQARRQSSHIIHLDLQRVDEADLVDSDTFLHYLASFIARTCRLDMTAVQQTWQNDIGAQDRLTFFMEDHLLNQIEAPVILALDEADRLLETGFHTSFFALLRFWHNQAAYDPLWEKLHIALVISTEPYLLISDVNQSPFNAGLKLYLQDFDEAQSQTLNQRHGSPISNRDFPDFMRLLNGHPYLTRMALYTLVTEHIDWTTFTAVAIANSGPFADHLHRQHWLLQNNPPLQQAFKQILQKQECDDPMARYRLLRAGLINAAGDSCTCRCDLYRRYFETAFS